MPILGVGGEDADFEKQGQTLSETNPIYFRPNYARCALMTGEGNQKNSGWLFKMPTNLNTFWMTAQVYIDSYGNGPVISFHKSGVPRLLVRARQVTNMMFWHLSKKDAAGTETTLFASNERIITGRVIKVDVNVNYAPDGFIRVYAEGVLRAEYLGDVTTDDALDLDYIRLSAPDNTATWAYWSEFILASEDTRNLSLARLTPLAAGNLQEWQGSVTDVNEVTLNDTTVISTPDDSKTAQFTVTPAAILSTPVLVRSVHINARVAVGETGPQSLRGVVRSNDADFSKAMPATLVRGRSSVRWDFNPSTDADWTPEELVDGFFNIGLNTGGDV